MPKTIFGTTEKSNFILNMKSETLQKWISAMLLMCVVIPQLGNLFITGLKGSTALLGAFLYLTGFSCILFFIITMLKKELSFKENKIYFAVIFMAVWAFASYYGIVIKYSASDTLGASASAEFIKTALLGELGRYEGLLAIFAYIGIFLLATAVTKESVVKLVMDFIVGAGIVQALIALLQHIPKLNFLTEYADLPTVALKNVMLSSGLSDSPILFGSFLTITTAIAFVGAVFDSNIIRARIYSAAAVLFLLTGLFTSSIVPIIGISCVFVIVTIVAIVNKVKGGTAFENGILKTAFQRYLALTAAMLVTFVLIFFIQGIYIRDKAIAYYDAYYRLFIVTNYSPVDEHSLYEIGWGRSLELLKNNWLLGVGPDCFAKTQALNADMSLNQLDKSYNEYLFIAVTRGVPSLIAYVIFIAYVIKRAFGGVKKFFSNTEKWYLPALLTAVSAYLIQALFSVSSVTVAPLFWLLAGIICAKKIADKKGGKH